MKKKALILLMLFGLSCAFSFAQPRYSLTDESSIHQAARSGDIKSIEASIEEGIDPNLINYLGYAPLHLAIFYNQLEAIKALLRLGADPNIEADFGTPSLHLAIDKGNLEAIRILIKAGADLDKQSNYGQTPLHQAVNQNNLGAIKILIEAGADLDIPNILNQTSLELARFKENQEIIDFLEMYILERRGQSNLASHLITLLSQNNNNNSHYNSDEDQEDFAKSLKDSSTAITYSSYITHSGEYSLHELVQRGDLSSIKAFIEDGVDLNSLNSNGYTPLHLAVRLAFFTDTLALEVIQFLIEAGADFNIQDNHGWTVLDMAVGLDIDLDCITSKKIINLFESHLIEEEREANSNLTHCNARARNTLNRWALYQAINQGDVNSIEALIKKGVDPNAQCFSGRTPLYQAIASNQLEAVEALLRLGANINGFEGLIAGWTPLHLAIISHNNLEIVKLLIEENRSALKRALTIAKHFNRLEIVNFLEATIAEREAEDNSDPYSVIILQANNNNTHVFEQNDDAPNRVSPVNNSFRGSLSSYFWNNCQLL